MTFLKEAGVQDEKQSTRSHRVKKLAIRVFQLMQYELEDIESLLSPKYQRKMLSALIENDSSTYNWVMNYRWQLRLLQHVEPGSSPIPNAITLPSDRELCDARNYLVNWLEDAHSTIKTPKLEFFTNFEIGEFLIATNAWADAKAFFDRAATVFQENPSLQVELERARSHFDGPMDHILVSKQLRAPDSKIPRSTITIPLVEARLRGFLGLIRTLNGQPAVNSRTERLRTLQRTFSTATSPEPALAQEILDLLKEDNQDPHLSLVLRVQLQTLPALEMWHDQIVSLNAISRLLHTEDVPNPSWLLGVRNGEVLLRDMLETWNSLSDQERKRSQFKKLAELIISDFQVKSCLDIAKKWIDTTAYEILLHKELILIESIENVSLNHETSDSELLDDFNVLSTSDNESDLLRSSVALRTTYSEKLPIKVLEQRISSLEAINDYHSALTLHKTVKMLTGQAISWAHLLDLIASQQPNIDWEQVYQSLTTLIESDAPSMEQLCRLEAAIIDYGNPSVLAHCHSVLARFPQIRFYQTLDELSKAFLQLIALAPQLHPSEKHATIGTALADCGAQLEVIIRCLSKEEAIVRCLVRFLHRSALLITLSGLLLVTLDFLYTNAKVPKSYLHVDRVSKTIASLSLERGHEWVRGVKGLSLTEESRLVRLCLLASRRMLLTSPSHASAAAYTTGDLHMHKSQYANAMRYYLLAGALGNFGFDPDFLAIIPSLITCFVQAQMFHIAIVLHQYVPKVDYQSALALASAWGHIFPTEHQPFLFDVTILEALIHACKQHGELNAATQLAEIIAKPDQTITIRTSKLFEACRLRYFQMLVKLFVNDVSMLTNVH